MRFMVVLPFGLHGFRLAPSYLRGLAASFGRTLLWGSPTAVVYAKPGNHEGPTPMQANIAPFLPSTPFMTSKATFVVLLINRAFGRPLDCSVPVVVHTSLLASR